MNTRKGFTLVELLVVIAILAILATVSVVGYTSFIENANESIALQEMTQIRDALIAEDITNDKFDLSEDTMDADAIAAMNTFANGLGLNGTFTAGETSATYVPNGKDVTATWTYEDGKIETATDSE